MRRASLIVALVLHALVGQRVRAQAGGGAPSAAELQRAATLFAASNWQQAHDAYAALAKQFPTHPLSRFRVGVTLTELGRAAEGESHLRAGEKLGVPAAQSGLRLAESLAEQRKGNAAIGELKRAAAGGLFLTAPALGGNAHFASLKAHPQWQGVLDAFAAIVQPCRHDPRFREFDFWVGDWDVRPVASPPGTLASRNRITLEENGCIVQEHWEGQGGSTGQSFNLFDRSVGKWRQTWVDNGAGQHDYAGGLVGNDMVLEGTTPAPNGQLGRIPTRLTLFHISADSVRQFSEVSNDGGKTWQVAYNLMYVRRKP